MGVAAASSERLRRIVRRGQSELASGGTQFTALASGTPNTAVNWFGHVRYDQQRWWFTAPAVTHVSTATIVATSQSDISKTVCTVVLSLTSNHAPMTIGHPKMLLTSRSITRGKSTGRSDSRCRAVLGRHSRVGDTPNYRGVENDPVRVRRSRKGEISTQPDPVGPNVINSIDIPGSCGLDASWCLFLVKGRLP